MDIKNIITNEEPIWKLYIEDSLNDFPIMLTSNQWMNGTDFHIHPGLEIHITHEGVGRMVVGREILLQSPRSVLIFRGKVPHQMISNSSYKRSVIGVNILESDMFTDLHSLIDFRWIPDDTCLSFSLNPKQFLQLEEMCRTLSHELHSREVGWERLALVQVLQITVLLQRSSLNTNQVTQLSTQSVSNQNNIVQICSDYVCQNLDSDLSLKTVAKRFSVSGAHLTRSFSKDMGISYYQYVILQRVTEGKRLLRELPDVSIYEIASMVGFQSSSHFSQHFKLLTESTPSAYRNTTTDK